MLKVRNLACCSLVLTAVSSARSQTSLVRTELPDAPSAMLLAVESGLSSSADAPLNRSLDHQVGISTPQPAKKWATTIQPGQVALPLSAGDKFALSVRRQLTLGTLAASTFSAGYSHLLDNRPHYGTDSAGFGERLGASALRSTTQSIFNYGILSPIFRDDPRYYVLGDGHKFKHRAIYAATRVVITRKDSGSQAVNYPLLGAIAASSALTNAYYPQRDQDAGKTISGALTTLALRAGLLEFSEFSGDVKRHFFHKQ